MRRSQRLRRPEQFRRVREKGGRWNHRLLGLTAARNRAGRTRAGFVTGKQLGGAVVRNRFKRRARETVRRLFGQISPGWDLVFVIRPALAEATPAELEAAVLALLRQAGLWQPPPEIPDA